MSAQPAPARDQAVASELELTHLHNLAARMGDFAAVCEAVEAACAREDVDALLELSIMARHVRAAIAGERKAIDRRQLAETAETIGWMASIAEARQRASGGEQLLDRWMKRTMPSDAELLASPQGVVAFAEALLPPVWNLEEDLVVLCGRGLEDVAEVLLRAGQKRIMVYAPDDLEVPGYPGRVIVARTLANVHDAIGKLSPHPPQRVVVRTAPDCGVGREQHHELADRVEEALRDIRVYRNTLTTFGDMWLTQSLANVPAAASWPSVASLRSQFVGKPAVIVAPGPSLAKNVELLHQFVDRAVIITFSHTLTALKAAGIMPDLVLTVDANALQYHFRDFPMEEVGAMVSGIAVKPDLFELPAPMHFTMGANATVDTWLYHILGENALVPAGGSVATSAFSLAVQMRCDPIIVMGLDLSFPGGKYYIDTSCDGALEVKMSADGKKIEYAGWSDDIKKMFNGGGPIAEPEAEPLHELPGYYGGTVPTSFMFSLYHLWFVHAAEVVGDRARMLNCTEGGAYIEGMDHISLAEAYEQCIAGTEPMGVRTRLAAARDSIDVGERRRRLHGAVKQMRQAMATGARLAKKCLSLTRQAEADPRAARTLRKLEKQLVGELRKVAFLSMLHQGDIERAVDRANHASTMAELLDSSRQLFAAVVQASEAMLPHVEAAETRLAAMLRDEV